MKIEYTKQELDDFRDLVEENLDAAAAKKRCEELNAAAHPQGEEYFVVRSDDAKVRTIESIT